LGPIAGLDTVEKRKIICPGGNRTLVDQPVAHRYALQPLCISQQIAALLYQCCAPLNFIFLLQIAYIKSEKLGDHLEFCNLFLHLNYIRHKYPSTWTHLTPPPHARYVTTHLLITTTIVIYVILTTNNDKVVSDSTSIAFCAHTYKARRHVSAFD
jgi:hypothetical protein